MIRVEAATVLLQWSAGGLFFLWFTTRRREVGLGYGWLLRGVYGVLAVVAAWCGFRFGAVPVREASSIAVATAAAVALAVSVVRKGAGVSGAEVEHDRRSERVAAMTGIDRRTDGTVTAERTDRTGRPRTRSSRRHSISSPRSSPSRGCSPRRSTPAATGRCRCCGPSPVPCSSGP